MSFFCQALWSGASAARTEEYVANSFFSNAPMDSKGKGVFLPHVAFDFGGSARMLTKIYRRQMLHLIIAVHVLPYRNQRNVTV